MKKLKNSLSTAIVSDVLDEMGYKNQMLPIEIKPNFNEAKIFGKARIITLKPINDNENYTEIYKGLYFLESINAGDVLVVGNAFDKHAFFGELMSKLAKSNGVEGAIINGCTRDKLETIRLRYPVFSKNNIAQDIKKRGTIDEIDAEKTIIGGVEIKKGDYILADLDGVIVIPSAIRQEVFARSLKIYENEKRIKKSISNGQAVDKILKRFGEF